MSDKGESSVTVTVKKEKNKGKEVVMDTPDKNKTQITPPIFTFEDSPVFNFLNSLSPIKPVKSAHIPQSFNSLSFSSPPSVFTSPHLTSVKESRFLRRHQLGDPSKPEFSSDNVNKDGTNQENITPEGNIEVSVEPSYERSNRADELVQEEYGKVFQGTDEIVERENEIDQNKEGEGCDWEAISDAADLLILYSPNHTVALKKPMDPETRFYASTSNDQASALDNGFTQPEEGNELREFSETEDIRGLSSLEVPHDDSVDPENVSNLYRGMRRRCLVFDLSGACKKHLHENSTSESAIFSQSDVLSLTNDSSRRALPGIGLHLNTLTTTSKECKVIKNEAFASGRQLLIAPSTTTNHHLLNTGLDSSSKLLNTGLDSSSKLVNVTQSDGELAPVEKDLLLLEDSGNSPKKKRPRLENGEGSTCKRCNCKKSKCLKLYCECFAAGVYCVEPCSCLECFNKPIHEETVLATRKQIESRNPLAFAPKVIRTSDTPSEMGVDPSKTPASARHKRGCNCKKSGCLKKYCECYQGGVGCSINCRCEACKNTFGRKDGSEVELEEETEMIEKSVVDRSHHRTVFRSDVEHNNPDYTLPATPLPFVRQSVQLPFQSNNKPPRSTFVHVGSSSSAYGKPNFLQHQSKFDSSFGRVEEHEMPEILQTNRSPISGVKSGSPNSKRVSPPHYGAGQKSSRKLILQSIPSFPSLAPKQ